MTLDELIEELQRVKHVMQDENDGKGIGHYEIVTEGCDCLGDVGTIEVRQWPGAVSQVYLMRKKEEVREPDLKAEEQKDVEKFGSDAALLPE